VLERAIGHDFPSRESLPERSLTYRKAFGANRSGSVPAAGAIPGRLARIATLACRFEDLFPVPFTNRDTHEKTRILTNLEAAVHEEVEGERPRDGAETPRCSRRTT
jgi:hypothetical protein